jgi:hypothetical protein
MHTQQFGEWTVKHNYDERVRQCGNCFYSSKCSKKGCFQLPSQLYAIVEKEGQEPIKLEGINSVLDAMRIIGR